jgi:hypothetical protein
LSHYERFLKLCLAGSVDPEDMTKFIITNFSAVARGLQLVEEEDKRISEAIYGKEVTPSA